MSKKAITYKVFSVFLTSIIFLISMPIAFAATPAELSSSNITAWPIVTYTNNAMYYGQKIEDAVTLSGGTVEYNGNIVPGHFEFIDPSLLPTSDGTKRADIKFIPEDTSSYVGFEAKRCRNVTYVVSETTPVYVDEVNDPLIATEVEAGATLSTSILSGGKMINPYNPEEPEILARTWEWSNPNTVVNESGYYEAMFVPASYTKTTVQVYVRIAGSIPETTITEMPTISNFTYDPNISWKDIEISGGKAVLKVEGTEVAGTFTVTDKVKDFVPIAGTHNVPVVFTPNNLEAALPYSFEITNVVVNPAPIAFVDEEGNAIEDFTFEVDPGTKMNDVKALITTNLRIPKNAVISVEDNNGYAENGRKYKLTVLHDDPNYTGKDLYFTVLFKEKAITPSLKWVGEGKLKVDCGNYSPPGSFAVYYVIGETETKIGDVKGNSEILEWTPTSSGDYGFKVVYNSIENDYFIIESVTTTNYSHFPEHKLIATGSLATLSFSMGETATVTAPATDPALLDKPYYGFTGWTDVKGNTGLSEEELANATVSFAMPDGDVELTANYKFSIKLYFEWVWQQIVQFFTFIINAVKDLFALATV